MAEPADSALVIAQRLLNDNRSAVAGKTATGYRVALLPTFPDGKAFVAQKADGTDATGTEVVATATACAHLGSADVARLVVPIDFATTSGAGTGSKYVRKQLFTRYVSATGATTTKWCYTNKDMWPLKADGTKALRDLSDAANALTTPLTAVGEAVTNFSQPGPIPGVYEVNERQQGYVRSLAWTCKLA